MNQQISSWDLEEKIKKVLKTLQDGKGVIVTDDKNREDEADIIYSAQFLTSEQMALMIRECSGIVCLCLTSKKVKELNLPMMVQSNNSKYQTPFTISIEAKNGVTTGVSAKDRVTTIKAAIAEDGVERIVSPGHIFPLCARDGGVLERGGHTESGIDLMKLANLNPTAVLCELTNPDGTMAKGEQITSFAQKHSMPIISVNDIKEYRKLKEI